MHSRSLERKRRFSKEGYSTALLARQGKALYYLEDEINCSGGHAAAFPLLSYSHDDVSSTWISVREKFPTPDCNIRAAVFNAGQTVFKPFLEITPEGIQNNLEVSISGAFAFSRQAILAFKDNSIEESLGTRGTLIFTGATASLRGNPMTSLLAAGKFGARALSQSLAKEFGRDNIHVSNVIVDGMILTDCTRQMLHQQGGRSESDADTRLTPENIAEVCGPSANRFGPKV
ncbi:NAD(P)-binding protein [Macrolepiota fuliginosa MF-IS2]|uniref:NAD(P)-binding protein n=1 Tax=Macrolepiota fuliginosa MF-IS2 TaxID=1400762 RepID=A0A9P6C2B2_9AGAR|nr:NAD(P)-binding protein [Macrolepiota fuliginosa MF-IS2]